ncbi:MAG: TIGR03643 family protein [Flammeovirgaceae bacterium]|nr:TIGR03643 family protein [Flammeovirgaceae bacterium]
MRISAFSVDEENRIIEMAWEDRTPFEAINYQFSLSEKEVVQLMRSRLKKSSFKLWRTRIHKGISQKHSKIRNSKIQRFKCTRQRSISNNKISKR